MLKYYKVGYQYIIKQDIPQVVCEFQSEHLQLNLISGVTEVSYLKRYGFEVYRSFTS